MSGEASLDLVRALLKEVAQPSATPGSVAAVLAEHGYPDSGEHITRLAGDRHGAQVGFTPGSEMAIGLLEEAFGPARSTRSLDSDGPAEKYWDIPVDGPQHVVLTAELDDSERLAIRVRLTPYSM
jgi:hypothetical protein